jgi:ribose-phosphate pyrophosphokinase
MNLTILAGSANLPLAESIADRLGVPLGGRIVGRFPDSELNIELEQSVRGQDVYLVQPTGPPVDEHLLELIFLADACRRAGAERMTAIIPYFGYARQDRRATGRGPVGARIAADLIATVGVSRIVAVDLHMTSLEGFFPVPLEHLAALPILVPAISAVAGSRTVIVSPDLGGVKLAERYARTLHAPTAVVYKRRLSGERVEARGVVGDVRGLAPLIVDDMITTAGTIEAAINALLAAGCDPQITVVCTHGLFVGPAIERLRGLPIKRLFYTDSVRGPDPAVVPVQRVSLAPLLADAIDRLHNDRSLADLIVHA